MLFLVIVTVIIMVVHRLKPEERCTKVHEYRFQSALKQPEPRGFDSFFYNHEFHMPVFREKAVLDNSGLAL